MSTSAIHSLTLLLCLVALPYGVINSESSPLFADVRNGQFFSRFKCASNDSQVHCASDNPTKSFNCSSREQCCYNSYSRGWSWFNFIDNENQTKSAGGECQLFDQKPRKSVAQKTRCSLYKSDSVVLNQTEINTMCKPSMVVIMDRSYTTSSWGLPWSSYKNGFSLADSSYWLGLEQVHQLTSSASYRLRVEYICSGASVWTTVEYQSFVIGNEVNTQYTLSVSGYSGNGGDQLTYHNGMMFSTLDKDNDLNSGSSCSQSYQNVGWWFKSCWTSCLTYSPPQWACGGTAARMSIILNQ